MALVFHHQDGSQDLWVMPEAIRLLFLRAESRGAEDAKRKIRAAIGR